MNVRLVQFSLGPGKRSIAEGIADKVVPAIRAQPGCEKCTFFADYEAGDYGLIDMWASKQAAEAAAVIGPIMTAAMTEARPNAESRRLFDIYEPKQK